MSLDLQNKKIAVLGLAVNNDQLIDYLLSQGVNSVTVFDEKPLDPGLQSKYEHLGVQFIIGPLAELPEFDIIFRTPGINPDRPVIKNALASGLLVTSGTQLFLERAPGITIGITGTKGKGTTSQLLYNILAQAKKKVFLGGNIGVSPFTFLSQLDKDSVTVLELSSFQLVDLTISPHMAIVLMVTSEHLDYHVTAKDYINAKSSIAKFQTEDDVVIYNVDYPATVDIAVQSNGMKLSVCVGATLELPTPKAEINCYIRDGNIIVRLNDTEETIMPVKDIALIGKHNWENVCAAVLAAKVLEIDNEAIIAAVTSFTGLEHRLEFVAEKDGVRYYDDSISTTPESAIAAIQAFDQPKILILGGSSKQSDFTEVGNVIRQSSSIKAIAGMGQEWPKIKQAIGETKIQLIEDYQTMDQLIGEIKKISISGDVVILSPACASFGMFKDYKDRGQQFKDAVNKL